MLRHVMHVTGWPAASHMKCILSMWRKGRPVHSLSSDVLLALKMSSRSAHLRIFI